MLNNNFINMGIFIFWTIVCWFSKKKQSTLKTRNVLEGLLDNFQTFKAMCNGIQRQISCNNILHGKQVVTVADNIFNTFRWKIMCFFHDLQGKPLSMLLVDPFYLHHWQVVTKTNLIHALSVCLQMEVSLCHYYHHYHNHTLMHNTNSNHIQVSPVQSTDQRHVNCDAIASCSFVIQCDNWWPWYIVMTCDNSPSRPARPASWSWSKSVLPGPQLITYLTSGKLTPILRALLATTILFLLVFCLNSSSRRSLYFGHDTEWKIPITKYFLSIEPTGMYICLPSFISSKLTTLAMSFRVLQKMIVFGIGSPLSLTSSISQSSCMFMNSFFTLLTENRKLTLFGLIKMFVLLDFRQSCLHMVCCVILSAVPVKARTGTPNKHKRQI